MKLFAIFILLSSVAHSKQLELNLGDSQCMSNERALYLLKSQVHNKIKVCDDSFDNSKMCISKKELEYLDINIRCNNKKQVFSSSRVYEWYCAMGAQCWSGFTLDCNGELGTWLTGES